MRSYKMMPRRVLCFLVGQFWMVSLVVSGPRLLAQTRADLPPEVIAYPQLVLYGGKVLTADDSFSVAQAVAIRDGKFLAVGQTDPILKLAGPNTRKIDLKGKAVTPGFIAHHLHLPDYSYFAMLKRDHNIQWEGRWFPGGDKLIWDNVDQLLRDVKKLADISKPGEWIVIVAAFEAGPLIYKLKRSELDAASSDHPTVLITPTATVNAANSLALKLAKLSPDTPGFPQGDQARVSGEEIDWRLSQASAWSFPTEKVAAALKRKIAEYNTDGITTLGGTRIMPSDLTALREVWVQGELTMRWRVGLKVLEGEEDPEKIERMLQQIGNLTDIGDDMLRISGMYMQGADGAPFDGGAWTFEPKLRELPGNPPRPYGARGPNEKWPGQAKTTLVVKYGWSTANAHSAGDRATAAFLDAYEEGKKNQIVKSSNQRLAVDHLVIVRPQDIQRFKELGVIPSISPWFLFKKEENELAMQQYDTEKMNTWMPAKSYIDAGLRPSIEEDIDGEPYRAPLWSMEKFINRKDDNGRVWNLKEKVTRQQALWMMTNWTSYYIGEQKKLGTIEPGKLADLVVLDRDYMTVPEDEIGKIPVLITMVGGQIVYQADGMF